MQHEREIVRPCLIQESTLQVVVRKSIFMDSIQRDEIIGKPHLRDLVFKDIHESTTTIQDKEDLKRKEFERRRALRKGVTLDTFLENTQMFTGKFTIKREFQFLSKYLIFTHKDNT
eukprot:TRINITY_DN8594_c0_g1_i2.p4 TRINITY_DN8594_c0_g1~~TRINITY_DN8594_c0_g1_i2.p4  ORF type:complete len:116 (+),score=3.18 TRINITY_DN8594_c0_g1_i2:1011-1358(+)